MRSVEIPKYQTEILPILPPCIMFARIFTKARLLHFLFHTEPALKPQHVYADVVSILDGSFLSKTLAVLVVQRGVTPLHYSHVSNVDLLLGKKTEVSVQYNLLSIWLYAFHQALCFLRLSFVSYVINV
eukprot:gb/GECG01006161.1/.p1 GENE.gb/GECG01006161.1/~~gb/GECG01006161.1/.p1  ORF type:complete len:128 (+),score=2.06 gb/GECG01006161.1/:1-384(+)